MRKNILFVLILCTFLANNIHLSYAQTRSYQGTMEIVPLRLEQKGDLLFVDVDIVLNNIRMKTAQGVNFIPQLVSPEKVQALPMVSLKGNNEFLAYERTLSLMSKREKAVYEEPYLVKKVGSVRNDTIHYRYFLPYEEWMADSRLDIQRDECGCGEVELMLVENIIDKVTPDKPLVPYVVTPHVAFIKPEAEQIKQRAKEAKFWLNFVVNRINLLPDYMDNPRELAKIHAMIDELHSDKTITVNRLEIIGYASPEGTLAHNKKLSEGRAIALRDYLASHYDFPRHLYNVEFGGENWDGLVEALQTINIQHKEEILQIIRDIPIEQGREKKIMELYGGEPYRYMLKNIFPSLRIAICRVSYNVQNFNVEQAKEIIKNRPQNLSLEEMFLVANTYPEGSQEFIDVFETAVRMFPDNEVANLNAASSAILRKDLVSAERYLKKVNPQTHPAEYNNSMGLVAILNNEYEKAEKYFKMASTNGLKVAEENLKELELKK